MAIRPALVFVLVYRFVALNESVLGPTLVGGRVSFPIRLSEIELVLDEAGQDPESADTDNHLIPTTRGWNRGGRRKGRQ